jgi:CheY-like chemotaxis protein
MIDREPPPFVDVLVIDDETAFHDIDRYVLGGMGLSMHGVPEGRAAMDYLAQAERLPRLLIVDVRMPVMDGWQFREAQLADPRLAGIPVLFTSGGHADDEERAADMGGAYIARPHDLDVFRALVEKLILPA